MSISTVRAIRTEAQLVHVALLNVFVSVLVDAILLTALPEHPKEAAHGHSSLVILVEEATGISLHAEATEPVATDSLPEASPPGTGR